MLPSLSALSYHYVPCAVAELMADREQGSREGYEVLYKAGSAWQHDRLCQPMTAFGGFLVPPENQGQ